MFRGAGPRLGHDEVAARHERLLVRGGDHLAGPKRRQDGAEAHNATRPDHHEVDVVARRELDERIRAVDAKRAGRN
jgi:hypothetical protein